ncbi:hypothetical protein ACVWY3_007686 [Bradyrhizobium sp. USDA 4486]
MGHDLRPENWTIYDQSIRNSCVMTLCNDYFAWPAEIGTSSHACFRTSREYDPLGALYSGPKAAGPGAQRQSPKVGKNAVEAPSKMLALSPSVKGRSSTKFAGAGPQHVLQNRRHKTYDGRSVTVDGVIPLKEQTVQDMKKRRLFTRQRAASSGRYQCVRLLRQSPSHASHFRLPRLGGTKGICRSPISLTSNLSGGQRTRRHTPETTGLRKLDRRRGPGRGRAVRLGACRYTGR